MLTYEMVGIADQNDRTYESKYGTYNAKDRFKFNKEAAELVDKKGYRELFDKLMHENLWKLKQEPVKEMTLQEIEKELGYRVIIRDFEPEASKAIEFYKHLFGLDHVNPEDYKKERIHYDD